MSFGKNSGVHIFLMKNGQADDRLRISCDPDSKGYVVTFDQYTVGNHSEVVMPYMSDVTRHLDRFIEFLLMDAEPYEKFQIDIPGLPAVVVDRSNLYWNRDLIQDAVHDLKHDWPHECVKGSN